MQPKSHFAVQESNGSGEMRIPFLSALWRRQIATGKYPIRCKYPHCEAGCRIAFPNSSINSRCHPLPAVPLEKVRNGHGTQRGQEQEWIEPDALRYFMGRPCRSHGIIQKTEIRNVMDIQVQAYPMILCRRLPRDLQDFTRYRCASFASQGIAARGHPGVEHPSIALSPGMRHALRSP